MWTTSGTTARVAPSTARPVKSRIGAAFTDVDTAFTIAFLKPLNQMFSGGGYFGGAYIVKDLVFDNASFVNAVITFIITAAVIYF